MSQIKELIVDAYGCRLELSDPESIEKIAREALEAEGATVVRSTYYRFQPHGLTLCLILKESHFIISTWPEYKMAIVNIFLCNSSMSPMKVWNHFSRAIEPSEIKVHEVSHKVGEFFKEKSA
jgi:S-adenosylmethionine decarboxylase